MSSIFQDEFRVLGDFNVYNTKHRHQLGLPLAKNNKVPKLFKIYIGAKFWNTLPFILYEKNKNLIFLYTWNSLSRERKIRFLLLKLVDEEEEEEKRNKKKKMMMMMMRR